MKPCRDLVGISIAMLLGLHGMAHGSPISWYEYSSDPVYNPGQAYYPTVLKQGSTYTMWSESATGLQMATSPDGINWTTNSTPVTGLTNPRHTVVEQIGDEYRIWYWDSGADLYSINAIRTATSTDGLHWTDDEPVTQVGTTVVTGDSRDWNYGSYGPEDILYNPDGSSTLVTPVDKDSVWDNKYVMYYDGTTGGHESVGLAVSNDGVNWEGYDGGLAAVLDSSPTGWDSGYVGYGTVVEEGPSAFQFWYSGGAGDVLNQGIGYAFSTDGINWVKYPNPIFYITDGVAWRDARTYTPMVIGNQMWFSGVSGSGTYAIGYATDPDSGSIPEPGTLGLLGMGILTLLVSGKKRRTRPAC